jgi:hypothetical protein
MATSMPTTSAAGHAALVAQAFTENPNVDIVYGHGYSSTGSVRGVVGIMSGIISEKLFIAYYAARSNF